MTGRGIEAEADWATLDTPETYLGHLRAERFASEAVFDRRHAYAVPDRLPPSTWALRGEWTIGPDRVALDRAGGGIVVRFQARDAHLVMGPAAGRPIPFRVVLDGQPPGASHGADVDADGDGRLGDGRLYGLIRQRGAVRRRTVEITFLEPGATAYALTFG